MTKSSAKHLVIYAGAGFFGALGDNDAFLPSLETAKANAALLAQTPVDTLIVPFLHINDASFGFDFHNTAFDQALSPVLPVLQGLRNGDYGAPRNVLLTMGGGSTRQPQDFAYAEADPVGFAGALTTLFETYPFNGFDLDYEGGTGTAQDLLGVVKAINAAMPDNILTAAPCGLTPTSDWTALLKNTVGTAGQMFDWLNIQFYSYGDPWKTTYKNWSTAIKDAGIPTDSGFLLPGWYADQNGTAALQAFSDAVKTVDDKTYYGGSFIFSYGDIVASGDTLAQWVSAMQGQYTPS